MKPWNRSAIFIFIFLLAIGFHKIIQAGTTECAYFTTILQSYAPAPHIIHCKDKRGNVTPQTIGFIRDPAKNNSIKINYIKVEIYDKDGSYKETATLRDPPQNRFPISHKWARGKIKNLKKTDILRILNDSYGFDDATVLYKDYNAKKPLRLVSEMSTFPSSDKAGACIYLTAPIILGTSSDKRRLSQIGKETNCSPQKICIARVSCNSSFVYDLVGVNVPYNGSVYCPASDGKCPDAADCASNDDLPHKSVSDPTNVNRKEAYPANKVLQ